jgi:hypothetical protein
VSLLLERFTHHFPAGKRELERSFLQRAADLIAKVGAVWKIEGM